MFGADAVINAMPHVLPCRDAPWRVCYCSKGIEEENASRTADAPRRVPTRDSSNLQMPHEKIANGTRGNCQHHTRKLPTSHEEIANVTRGNCKRHTRKSPTPHEEIANATRGVWQLLMSSEKSSRGSPSHHTNCIGPRHHFPHRHRCRGLASSAPSEGKKRRRNVSKS